MRRKRTVGGIVLVVAMAVGCIRSPQAKEAAYLEKGKKEFQKKNYQVAVLHFKNALHIPPFPRAPERLFLIQVEAGHQ